MSKGRRLEEMRQVRFCGHYYDKEWLKEYLRTHTAREVMRELLNQNQDKDAAERALKYFRQEIRYLEAAPAINGREMTDEWREQLEYCTLAVKAIEKWRGENGN